MLTEAFKQIGDRPVYLWAFQENARARRFYEKNGFYWDGSERVSEFDGALEVRYVKPAPRNQVQLLRAAAEDAELIRAMQQASFAELLEKYQDHDTNPANESIDRILWKIQNPNSFYYFIKAGEETVGCIRVADAGNSARKRISPLYQGGNDNGTLLSLNIFRDDPQLAVYPRIQSLHSCPYART